MSVLMSGAVPLYIAIGSSAIGAVSVALLMGYPVLRVRGPYFVILTFGLAELVKHIVLQIEVYLGQFSRLIFNAPSVLELLYLMLALATVSTILASYLRSSKFGRGLISIRENEEAAEAVGVPVRSLKMVAFVMSAAIPGIVGSLATLRTGYFEASQAFDPLISFSIVAMAVVGGSDRPRGPIIGSIAFVLLSELLWSRFPQVYMIVLGMLLISFMLFLPYGLSGIFERRKLT